MKYSALAFCAALLTTFAACNQQPKETAETPEKTEETPSSKTTAAPDSAAMMKAWMDYATPGEMHGMLAKSDGEWKGEITMWMTPDAPPTKDTGIAINKMILGGRYQESRHTGNFSGMPFEGISLLAYDNVRKKFINTWVDNFGTGVMVLEGTWDPSNYTINFTGKQVDPVSGGDIEVREVFKIIDDNTQRVEMYMKYPGAAEYKSMEIMSRRKSS